MKTLTYQVMGYTGVYNPETEEVAQHETAAAVTVECRNQAQFDVAFAAAEKEAIPGTIEVSGSFETESGEPSAQADNDAMLIDHEYRLTLLELGLTE